ncbi:MAG: exodeoxyribonuclease VII small subunit [Verrucomicrobia bacterium]|nr:exodeoxyribonuclease VII small subunit [Verrucomicrobiota bacterium]
MSDELNFEQAYEKLEKILEKMHSSQVSLDAALGLYEEADKLIGTCQKKLSEAESRVEILLKNREGNLVVDENNTVQSEPFIK